jgi:hypothetical protein
MRLPRGRDGCHWHSFDVLYDLAVRNGVIQNAEGLYVSGDRELVEAVFPEEDDVLRVFSKAGAKPGELVQDGHPLAEYRTGLTVVELQPGARLVG